MLQMFRWSLLFASVLLVHQTISDDPLDLATECSEELCSLPNCRCASTEIPGGLSASETPQFVLLTFDDDVSTTVYSFYEKIAANRYNPDGCPIQMTFFVSHEYTDYDLVHNLHAAGHEIALHSISHEALTTAWQTMTVDHLIDEFGGEKEIITHFANIPDEHIKGMRLPFLQLSGNNTFVAGKQIGLTYDSSWPTQEYTQPGLWPYTLDYKSPQDCEIGPCAEASIPGFWVAPMIDLVDSQNYSCSMVDACAYVPDNADDLAKLYITNFERQYNGNRAPFGMYMHAAYFLRGNYQFDAYLKFVDYLLTKDDVYLVSLQRMLQWVQNPKPLDQLSEVFPSCQEISAADCTPRSSCLLYTPEGYERYMTICSPAVCPSDYPWVGNPLGDKL